MMVMHRSAFTYHTLGWLVLGLSTLFVGLPAAILGYKRFPTNIWVRITVIMMIFVVKCAHTSSSVVPSVFCVFLLQVHQPVPLQREPSTLFITIVTFIAITATQSVSSSSSSSNTAVVIIVIVARHDRWCYQHPVVPSQTTFRSTSSSPSRHRPSRLLLQHHGTSSRHMKPIFLHHITIVIIFFAAHL